MHRDRHANLPLFQEELRITGIRDMIYWFVQFGPKEASTDIPKLKNNMAIDISFGTSGFSLVLARPFREVLDNVCTIIYI